jgi:hypothetical protein
VFLFICVCKRWKKHTLLSLSAGNDGKKGWKRWKIFLNFFVVLENDGKRWKIVGKCWKIIKSFFNMVEYKKIVLENVGKSAGKMLEKF